ncbi:hypothetical protein [Amycolatopsis sp. cmx-11-51]|uniref:hypothetical protein n=1 Tax=Amycolatopsis sp. cmx-11-51 TaxID=2785797 RepID=UPI0039E3EDA4
MPDPCLLAVSARLPPSRWSTAELTDAAGGRFSDRLTTMLGGLGVENRHSVLANYPEVLFAGAEPEVEVAASELAARAARDCLAKADVDSASIGLVLGVSSSPGRLLPSLACDLFSLIPEIPREAVALSLEYLGCSAMAKVVDTARWFLTVEPDKRVLVCFLEAITPLSPPLPGEFAHFSEVTDGERQSTVNAMHGFLFGDAAVAMLLGAEGAGPTFGPVAHLTNERPEDAELGTVPDGGSDIPVVYGRRLYTLGPEVTARGTHYAVSTVRSLLAGGTNGLTSASEASLVFLHTGSGRILRGLCAEFDVDPAGPEVASSYRIPREYGNTLGCSVPLMFADPIRREPGTGLAVAFGLRGSGGPAFAYPLASIHGQVRRGGARLGSETDLTSRPRQPPKHRHRTHRGLAGMGRVAGGTFRRSWPHVRRQIAARSNRPQHSRDPTYAVLSRGCPPEVQEGPLPCARRRVPAKSGSRRSGGYSSLREADDAGMGTVSVPNPPHSTLAGASDAESGLPRAALTSSSATLPGPWRRREEGGLPVLGIEFLRQSHVKESFRDRDPDSSTVPKTPLAPAVLATHKTQRGQPPTPRSRDRIRGRARLPPATATPSS